MPRETDPEARRLIAEVLRWESERWPDALIPLYGAMFALANRCEFPPGQAEFYRWARRVLRPYLIIPDERLVEHRMDALADLSVWSFNWIHGLRAALDYRRKPNIRSMLRASVRWRAADFAESMDRRHAKRRGKADFESVAAPGTPHTVAEAREVVARLVADGSPLALAVLLVGEGWTVAAAARRTGVSRPRIYRAMARLAREGEDDDGG